MTGTNSKRFIVLFLVTDIILMSLALFIGGTNTNYEQVMHNYTDGFDAWKANYMENVGNTPTDTGNQFLEKSFGDIKYAGLSIFRIFSNEPEIVELQGCTQRECNNSTYGLVKWGFLLYWSIIHILGGLEIYFIIINKKTS